MYISTIISVIDIIFHFHSIILILRVNWHVSRKKMDGYQRNKGMLIGLVTFKIKTYKVYDRV